MMRPPPGEAWLRRYEEILQQLRVEQRRLRVQTLPTLESPIPAEVGLLGGALTTVLLLKLREALTVIDSFCEQVTMLLQCASIPVRFVYDATSWYELERSVAAPDKDLLATAVVIRRTWQGTAADAYLAAYAVQSVATERLATACRATGDALIDGAEAAQACYAALLVLLLSGAAQLSVAVSAARSVVRLPAAISALGAAIDIFAGVNGLLAATRETFRQKAVGVQATSAPLLDVAVFPGGRWPTSGSPLYADGSVTDGDPSDWSVKRTPWIGPAPAALTADFLDR